MHCGKAALKVESAERFTVASIRSLVVLLHAETDAYPIQATECVDRQEHTGNTDYNIKTT